MFEFIDGFVKATFLLEKPSTNPKIPAYVTKIPINEKKITQYIPEEFKDFYDIIGQPQVLRFQ